MTESRLRSRRWHWSLLFAFALVGPAGPPGSDVVAGARWVPAGVPATTEEAATPSLTSTSPPSPATSSQPPTVETSPLIAEPAEAARREEPTDPFDLAVVGDSLTHAGAASLSTTIAAAGWRVHLDGLPSRSISYPADVVYSAVDQVASIKRAGIDPDTWVVQLGTNDLYFIVHCQCADQRQAAIDRIRMMLTAIGPGHRVVWVGVQNFEYPPATTLFNDVLAELVAAGEIDAVVDWETLSADHRDEWFVDDAHLSSDGYAAWVPAIVTALGAPRS